MAPAAGGLPLCSSTLTPRATLRLWEPDKKNVGVGPGAASPSPCARPAPPTHSFPGNILTSPRHTSSLGSFVSSFMPCRRRTMGPAAGWRRRRREGGGHLSQDNFFRGCGPKASGVFKVGMWVNFLGVGLCGLRCYCQ